MTIIQFTLIQPFSFNKLAKVSWDVFRGANLGGTYNIPNKN